MSSLVPESHLCAMGCFRNGGITDDEKKQRNANKKIERQLREDKIAYRATHRLLLLGKFRTIEEVFMWFFVGHLLS